MNDKERKQVKEKKKAPNTLLRDARMQRGWTQEDLAEKIGVTPLEAYRWETEGVMPYPHYRQLLCELFGKTPVELGLVKTATLPWNVPFRQIPYFIGRTILLEDLHQALVTSKMPIPIEALSGLGGVGKTQIAVEYAYRYRTEYQAVLWVQADSKLGVRSGMVGLASVLNLPEQQEQEQRRMLEAVKLWLEAHTAWLLIIDGVEEVAEIGTLLPQKGKGHIVLTTRSQAVGPLAHRMVIEPLSREEGITLLLRRAQLKAAGGSPDDAPLQDRDAAGTLVALMDGLPLALDQAGAYLEETQCGVAHYLDLFRIRRAELLGRRGGIVDGHPESVTTTFSLSFERVERSNAAAAELLRWCAFLDPNEIPETLFTTGAEYAGPLLDPVAADPMLLDQVFEAILKYSLVRRVADTQSLSMHRLVQAVIKDTMDDDTRRIYAERIVYAIASVLAATGTDMQRCEPYMPHALACVELIEQQRLVNLAAAHIYYMTGLYQRERALYKQAVVHCQGAVTLYEQLLGPDHWEVALALNNLALVYDEWGKYTEAEPRFRRILTMLEQTLPPDHPDLVGILHNLARCRMFQGDFSQAEQFCRRALAIQEKALGSDHLDLAPTLSLLATIYREQRKYSQAESLYTRALAIREQALPPGDLDIAYNLNALATNCVDQGAYDRAEALNLRALAIFEQVRGPDHPDVALCLMCLSDSYYYQKKSGQVKQANQRALAIYEQVGAGEHPNAARAMGNLAAMYEAEGDYAQAMKLHQQALASMEQALGPEHPDLVAFLWHYAQTLRKMGQEREALPLEARARTLRRQHQWAAGASEETTGG